MLPEATNRREQVVNAFEYVGAVRTQEWHYSAVWNREKYKGCYLVEMGHHQRGLQRDRTVRSLSIAGQPVDLT